MRILLLIFVVNIAMCQATKPISKARSSTRSWPCPVAEDIVPCICVGEDALDLSMDCSAAQNEAEIEAAFSNCVLKFPFLGFKKLVITHSGNESLESLSAGTFCLATFEDIRITGTKLTLIQEDVFSYSHETLLNLELGGNMLVQIPFETFRLYSKLQRLGLAYNSIPALPSLALDNLVYINVNGNPNLRFDGDTFTGYQSLKEIFMDNINAERLDTGTFDVPRLETLSLLDNQIERLALGTISSSTNSISAIMFSNNNISLIEEGFVTGMAEKASIEIMNNLVTKIEETVWTPIFNEMNYTGRLDLADNPISCDCDIEWLVDSPEAMDMITHTTTCSGGSPFLYELSPEAFDQHCTGL